MLTFSFTGVDGSMTECETLTSGMVGKEVQLLFDDSWNSLAKTVVFRAADVNRVVINPASSLVVIPEAVLARPFGKLFVGVYGTDKDGTVVIPTIMAEGPMIRYGADPIEDETAKELPVWENLQNQIGDLDALETRERNSLTDAVNELHGQATVLESDVAQLQETVSYVGEPMLLATADKTSLVGAINEVHSQLEELTQSSLTPTAAQLLVEILRNGTYAESQEEAIAALAEEWGITTETEPEPAPEPEPEPAVQPILYWDFRTGSLTDQINGTVATASDSVTLDAQGAHMTAANSYLLFPAALDGAKLSGHVLEVKYGPMSLNTEASTLRLACTCSGSQPATTGIVWTNQDCWSTKASVVTEFTDLNMFSNKTLYAKGSPDSHRIDWYCEDQLICTTEPASDPTHVSLGSSGSAAFPLVIEYVKIYPTS